MVKCLFVFNIHSSECGISFIMKIKIQRTHLEALDKPIPKYFGWGKSSYDTCVSYYYMIPLNFFVRFWGRIKYRYYELMQNDKLRIREHRIYSRGYTEGLKSIKNREGGAGCKKAIE